MLEDLDPSGRKINENKVNPGQPLKIDSREIWFFCFVLVFRRSKATTPTKIIQAIDEGMRRYDNSWPRPQMLGCFILSGGFKSNKHQRVQVRYAAPFAYANPASTHILDIPFLALPATQRGTVRQQNSVSSSIRIQEKTKETFPKKVALKAKMNVRAKIPANTRVRANFPTWGNDPI